MRRRILCVVYALIAIAALYGTWSQNLLYSGQPGGIGAHFLSDLRVNPASRSISIALGKTQWATQVREEPHPTDSRCSIGRQPKAASQNVSSSAQVSGGGASP